MILSIYEYMDNEEILHGVSSKAKRGSPLQTNKQIRKSAQHPLASNWQKLHRISSIIYDVPSWFLHAFPASVPLD